MEFYRQCVLEKNNIQTVSWIPEKFAKEKFTLELKKGSEWDDGWRVIEVGLTRLSEDVVVKQERNFKEFSYHMNKFGSKQKEGLK